MNIELDGYLGIFLVLVLSTTLLPIPEEIPVIAAGVLCGHSDTEFAHDRGNPDRLKWWFMLPVVIVGAVLGDVVLYGLGRLWGKKLLDRKWIQRRLITPEKRASIEKNFAERGIIVLLGVRLLPGIRGPVFFIAGSLRLPLWQFLVADAIYAIPIVNVMFWLAYMLTDQVMAIFHKIDEYKPLVMVAVGSGIAGALIQKYILTRHVSTGEAPHVPAVISKPAGAIGHAIESVYESAVDVVTGRHHGETPDGEKKPDEKGEQASGDAKPEAEAKKPEPQPTDNSKGK